MRLPRAASDVQYSTAPAKAPTWFSLQRFGSIFPAQNQTANLCFHSTKSSLAAAGTPPYKLQPSRARLRIRVVNSDDVQMGSRQGTKSMARPSSGSSADAQPRSGTASKRSRQALEENSRSKRQELQPEAAAARVAAASSQPPGGVVSKKPPGSPADVQASPSMGTNGQKPSAVTADLEQNSPRHQPSKKTKKRKKNGKVNKDCPVWKATVAALRAKNPAAAWAAYQSNKAEHDFKVSELQALAVLFLGLEDWAENVISFKTPDDKSVAIEANSEWAREVIEELEVKDKKKDETFFCHQARMCALKGDAEGALRSATECSAKEGVIVRLRTYTPALAAYARLGDGAGALRVFDAICAETTELTDLSEFEYKFLLHVLGEQNQFEDLQRVWLHMKENLGTLTPVAIRLVQQYFTKHAGVKPDGSPKWRVSTVQVDPKGGGHVEAAGGRLRQASLSKQDWEQFATGIRDLASKREQKQGHFEVFVRNMERRNFTIFLDAANIAFYNTLWLNEEGKPNARFQWLQVKAVYEAVKQKYPWQEVLVVVSGARTMPNCVHSEKERKFLDTLEKEKRLWRTPKGSNDDWYWLYGAASKAEKGILISNDKLRDHIFDLLRPRFFLKWRDNQICKYDVTTHADRSITAEVQSPPKFTSCIQKIEESGAWMFPMEDEKWLCARPAECS